MADYQPVTGVWEVTMGCNMRCRHCGSSCEAPLKDELSAEEALDVCDQIADLGLQWITLSGGEPFMRKDIFEIAQRLKEKGVIPNIITNGWLLKEETLQKVKEVGVGTLAISLDGLQDTHDYIRKEGSFNRSITALKRMVEMEIPAGVITTVHKRNLSELPLLREQLTNIGVRYWQFQIGLPMGNFTEFGDLLMEPSQVDEIIDFCYESMLGGQMHVYPADCVGYYNMKELQVRKMAHNTSEFPVWKGCNAGKRSLGILHNGEVVGCTSVRDRQYIEGSLREKSLRQIWENPDGFAWSRQASKSQLSGYCGECKYGDDCLGGCPNTRLTMHNTMKSENDYCSYYQGMSRTEAKLNNMTDTVRLKELAKEYIEGGEVQLASMVAKRALSLSPDDRELLSLYGFASFSINNWEQCTWANQQVLTQDPNNVYALKGLGLVKHRTGKSEEGIALLRQAISLAGSDNLDPWHDLAVVYLEKGQPDNVTALLGQLRTLAPAAVDQLVSQLGI